MLCVCLYMMTTLAIVIIQFKIALVYIFLNILQYNNQNLGQQKWMCEV